RLGELAVRGLVGGTLDLRRHLVRWDRLSGRVLRTGARPLALLRPSGRLAAREHRSPAAVELIAVAAVQVVRGDDQGRRARLLSGLFPGGTAPRRVIGVGLSEGAVVLHGSALALG